MIQFYSYLWLREDGTPYYVGKGQGLRAFKTHGRLRPPKKRSRIIVLLRGSEKEAFETEKELIRNWGRKDIGTGCLRNRTEGGEGTIGRKHTPEDLAKMKGRKYSPEESARRKERMEGVICGLHRPEIQALGTAASNVWKKNNPERVFEIARSVGLIVGRRNAESGHIQRLAHVRWHTNRNQMNPECFYCVSEAGDVSE
jgi:hypothetical protein